MNKTLVLLFATGFSLWTVLVALLMIAMSFSWGH
jgi:Tfp pilus assembly protein PilV